MSVDLSAYLMQATVQIEQTMPDGSRVMGTGFLVDDPTPDGRARTVMVTANHVFANMPGATASIDYREQDKDGGWRYDPEPIVIRVGKRELWAHHSTRDVAVIAVKAPAAFARAAIPLSWLAKPDDFTRYDVGPGDEMMVLGYPQGISADSAGFPILRSGRVASLIEAPSVSPTFLLDFHVFPGNSGGPVFISQAAHRRPGADQAQEVQFIAGVLTDQVVTNKERLEIGIVTDAKFVRETIALLDHKHAASANDAAPTATPATAPEVSQETSARVGQAIGD